MPIDAYIGSADIPFEPPALGASLPTRLAESTGTTYYVGGTGASDLNAGTDPAAPWATINQAFQNAPANAIVKVRAGSYSEGAITVQRGGSAGNTITVEADDPADKPTLVGTVVWQTTSAAYWRIRNVKLDANGGQNGWKCTNTTGTNSAHHIEFYGCEATGTVGQGAGFQVTSTEATAIQWWNCLSYANDVTLTTAHGWYLDGGHDMHAINCVAYGNGGYGFHCYNGTSTTQQLRDVHFYCCTSDDNVGRSGWLIDSDHTQATALANPDFIVEDVHCYNCISTNQQAASSAYGFRVHYPNITDLAAVSGFIPSTLENCLSYNNASGDWGGTNSADAVDITGGFMAATAGGSYGAGANPLFVDQAGHDYHLDAGSPAYNAGLADFTPTEDFDGNPRSVPTLGAFRAPEEA